MWQLLDGKHFLWDYGSTPLSNLSTIYFSWATYFIGIICLRWYMAEKTRIQKSHSILICYNLLMTIASLYVWHLSTWSLWKTLMHLKKHQPMHCHLTPTDSNQNEGWVFYAMYLCYLLRYFAYMDTVILVLRKVSIPIAFFSFVQLNPHYDRNQFLFCTGISICLSFSSFGLGYKIRTYLEGNIKRNMMGNSQFNFTIFPLCIQVSRSPLSALYRHFGTFTFFTMALI